MGVLSCGSCDGHLMRLELRRAGLDPDRDVTYKELWRNYGEIDGLASGELAAQLLVEPQGSFGEMQGVLRVVEPVSRAEPHFQWGLLVAHTDFIETQTDLLRRLLGAYVRGAQYCVAHPEETKTLVQPSLPDYAMPVIERALTRTLPYWNITGQVDMKGLEVAVETMVSLRAIPQRLNPADLVDVSGLPSQP